LKTSELNYHTGIGL